MTHTFSWSRGFSLIELIIVITIIGVLAAVLYPMLTGYFERSRDTDRIASIGSISRAMEVYFKDKARYPKTSNSGCITETELPAKYITVIPKDPRSTHDNGCGSNGQYGYGVSGDRSMYILTARMETAQGGNFSGSIDGYTGNMLSGSTYTSIMTSLKPKTGWYYIEGYR